MVTASLKKSLSRRAVLGFARRSVVPKLRQTLPPTADRGAAQQCACLGAPKSRTDNAHLWAGRLGSTSNPITCSTPAYPENRGRSFRRQSHLPSHLGNRFRPGYASRQASGTRCSSALLSSHTRASSSRSTVL